MEHICWKSKSTVHSLRCYRFSSVSKRIHTPRWYKDSSVLHAKGSRGAAGG